MAKDQWKYVTFTPRGHPLDPPSVLITYFDNSTDTIAGEIDDAVIWFLDRRNRPDWVKIVRNIDGSTTLFFPKDDNARPQVQTR